MRPSTVHSPEVSHRREIAAARSSKQKVKDTGDDEICTSAHKVGSIEDLLIKIFTGLPLKSLRLFKSVCKRWSSLITDPNFSLLRSRNPNADHPHGLFLQLQTDSGFAFVPLDHRIPIKRRFLITSFPFHPKSACLPVLHSCNGLVLCHEWPGKLLYVYNPTLNHRKLLPVPHIWYPRRFVSSMAIAFEPTKSSHYKIVYSREESAFAYTTTVCLEIYSSETGNWSVCGKTFSRISFSRFDRRVIYWRGAFHWVGNLEVHHLDFDIENPRFIQVENHRILNGSVYSYDDKLFMSCDCLLLVKMAQPRSFSKMNVYEMKNDYSSGWC